MSVADHRLLPGHKLGRYEVIRLLGAGGMGEVYLGHDTKLDRDVAIKLMAAEFGNEANKLGRFAQEAKAAAALNHPNIAHVYEIGKTDGVNFIAMEYIDGETLGSWLSRTRPNISRQIEIAAQAAGALAAAHASGIIHRDIKPDNLMIAGGQQLKILDFGLAKLATRGPVSVGTEDTTQALANTTPGMILGTATYMSPEQARGEQVDSRTDIFSLGVVIYEMLSGRRPFAGNSVVETLHNIISKEPKPAIEVNPHLPVEIGEILDKALAKDVSERYRHAGDLELDLRRLKRGIETNSLLNTKTKASVQTPPKPVSFKWIALASVLSIAGIAGAWWIGHVGAGSKRPAGLDKVTLTPLTSDPGYEGEPTFSPDGQTIAYVSDRTGNFEIFLKQISGGPDINITNNPGDDVQPTFSPDGKQIAFVSTRASSSRLIYKSATLPLQGGDIWVMPALGGPARKIAVGGNFPAWSPDGATIIYSNGVQAEQKILKVSAAGGAPEEIPRDVGNNVLYPNYSSDARWIVFETQPNDGVYVISASGGQARLVARGRRPTWNASSSAIIYSNGEAGKNYSLWQLPFSSSAGEVTGEPSPLTVGHGHDMQADVSRDGRMIAFTSQDEEFNIERMPFDAETGRPTGGPVPVTSGRNQNAFFDATSTGGSVVYESSRGSWSQIVRLDIEAGSVDQLTSDTTFICKVPKWSPDERTIAFIRRGVNETSNDKNDLWLMAADGANPQRVLEGVIAFQWMPNGREILYIASDRKFRAFDLTSRNSRQLNDETSHPGVFSISPDGQWVIAQSTRAGTVDLEVFSTSGGESRLVVESPREDYHPFVSPTGKWLYYQPDHKNIYRLPGPAQGWRQAEPQQITNFPESGLFLEDPQISGDGHYLFFSRARITGDIWIMDLGKLTDSN